MMEAPRSSVSDLLAQRSVQTAPLVRHVAWALTLLFLATALFLAIAPWQQSSFAEGRVVAYAPMERQQTLEAPVDGRVVRWHVREGSVLRAGDRVVEISDLDPAILTRLREERDAVVARLAAARRRELSLAGRLEAVTASRVAALQAAEARVRMAKDRVRAAEQSVAAAEAAQLTARLNIDRQKTLADKGLSSTRTVELAELERARTAADVARARATFDAASNEEQALRTDQVRIGQDASGTVNDAGASRASAQSEVAAAEAELARIEVRLARQASQAVIAPRPGTILRLVGGEGGEIVKAGDALAVLVPSTEQRAVELWVAGNDAPLLSEGREVRLQFEGWPALQFTGWPSVAVGSFGGRIKVIDATDNGKGQFRVLVLPDGVDPWPSSRYLRQGVRVVGWILLNRVRLGYELWRQFNGFPPIIAPAEPTPDKGGGKDKK